MSSDTKYDIRLPYACTFRGVSRPSDVMSALIFRYLNAFSKKFEIK